MKYILLLWFLAIYLALPAKFLPGTTLSYNLGYNLAQHYGTKDQAAGYQVKTILHHGFTTGINLSLPATEKLSLMYEASYVTKGSTENITIRELDSEPLVKPAKMKVQYAMDYVEFPVLLKLNVVSSPDLKLSTVAGMAMGIKVRGDYHLEGTIYFPENDGYSTINITDDSNLSGVNMFDYSLIYGGELDFVLHKFPLTLSYRFTIGWDYLDLPTYEDGSFDPVSLRNQSYAVAIRIPCYRIK